MKIPFIMGRDNDHVYNNLTLFVPFDTGVKGKPRESYEIALGNLSKTQHIHYIAHFDGTHIHLYRSEQLTDAEAATLHLDMASKVGTEDCHTDKTVPQDELRSLMVRVFRQYVLQAVDENLYEDHKV